MRTWGQIQRECDRAIQLPEGRWIGYIRSAYDIILDLRQWLGLRSTFELVTIPAISAGTASVANGSTAVTGTGTSWDPSLTRMQIQIGEGPEYYDVTITSATTATLSRPYESASAVDVAYKIFRQNYALPLTLKSVTRIRRPGRVKPLEQVSRGDLLSYGVSYGDPLKFAMGLPAGTDPAYKTVDLFPIPDLAMSLFVEHQIAPVYFNGRNSNDAPLDFVSSNAIMLMAKMLASADIAGRNPDVYKSFYAEAIKSMHEQENQRIGAVSSEPTDEFNRANEARLEYGTW